MDLVATVVRGNHVLAPAFGPLDRTAEFARDLGNEDFLAVDLELPAEASANIGSDDAQVVLGNSRHQRDEDAQDVRNLRR